MPREETDKKTIKGRHTAKERQAPYRLKTPKKYDPGRGELLDNTSPSAFCGGAQGTPTEVCSRHLTHDTE